MSDPAADFVQEGEEQITTLNNALLDLEQSPDDDEAMDEIFRTAHTLKGNCGAMGLTRASDLAHAIEDLLDGVKAGDAEVSGEVMDAIFDGVDALEEMITEFGQDGDVSTDPSDTIEALRSNLGGDSGPADIEEPTDEEIDAILARFEPPTADDHNAYLVRLAINEAADIDNGILVVDALIDAFDLIGTDPSREAIENEEYKGAFDAIFGTPVGEAAISSALDPVDEVADFKIVEVTGEFPEPALDDPFDEFTNPEISSEEANEMEVDDLLNEFNELDDIDDLADDFDDDELSEFDGMGEAGSFDDLIEEEEPEPTEPETTDSAEAASASDDEVVGDASSVFNELQDEVEMVGFDELQTEIDELEFEEFSDEEEVSMEELLGDDVDLEDDTFLEAEPQPVEERADTAPEEPEVEADAEEPEVEAEAEEPEVEAEAEVPEVEAEAEVPEVEAEAEEPEVEAEAEVPEVEAEEPEVEAEEPEVEAEAEEPEVEAEAEEPEVEAEAEEPEVEAEPEEPEVEAEPEEPEVEAEPEEPEVEAEPEEPEVEAEPEEPEVEAEPEEPEVDDRDIETIVAEEEPAEATTIIDNQYTLNELQSGPADDYEISGRWDLNKSELVEAVVDSVADSLAEPEEPAEPAETEAVDERDLETIVAEESTADATSLIDERYTLDDLQRGPADEYDIENRWDRSKSELVDAVVEAIAGTLEEPEPAEEPVEERDLETIVAEESTEDAVAAVDDRFTLDELQSGPAEKFEIGGRWDMTKADLVETLVDAVTADLEGEPAEPLDDAAEEDFAADDIEADADAFEARRRGLRCRGRLRSGGNRGILRGG
ncbi:MAG: Hpt domain-containing protein [Natrialbaceae archaeon]|nr:Hpt domain-containing protein [Natrialbaceae archaeon]